MSYWDRIPRRVSRRTALARMGVIGAGAVGVAVGCASPAAAPTAAPAAATAPAQAAGQPTAQVTATAVPAKYGGTRIRTSRTGLAPHYDPHMSTGSPSTSFGFGIAYSRLFKFKLGPEIKFPAFIPTGDLAESWQQNDELTLTVKLRPNAKWHNIAPVNGRTFTAEDAVYSINRMKTTGFPTASLMAPIDRAEAVDPLTLRLRLKNPDADLLINLGSVAAKMVAREAVDLKGDLKEGPTIGTSPWILDRDEPRGGSFMVRNPDYFLKGLPYADRLEWLVILDTPSVIAAMRTKQLDAQMTGIEKDDAEQLKKADPSLAIQVVRDNSGTEMVFRCDRPPFNDLRVRQAISKAIDRDVIANTLWGGSVWYNANITMPAAEWYLPEAEVAAKYKRDLEGARRLLREANAENLTAELTTSNISGGIFAQTAELIQAQVREVGVNLRIRVLETAAYQALSTVGGEFDILAATISPPTSANEDLVGRWHNKGSGNISKHADAELDALIERQARTLNVDDRKRLLNDIQRMALDRLYRTNINGRQRSIVYWPHLKNFYPGPGATYYDHWTTVWVDK